VFDYFHHRLHPGIQSEEEAFMTAYQTWDVRPIFHFSSSKREYEDPTAKREAHADFIYERINTYGKEVDIVLEAKMKEKALQKYLKEFSGPRMGN
jgi:UV DNA damage endonuclease